MSECYSSNTFNKLNLQYLTIKNLWSVDLTSAVAVNVNVIFFQTNNVLQHCRDKCASLPEWGILAHKTPGCFKFFVRLGTFPQILSFFFCMHWSTNRNGAYQKQGGNLPEFIMFMWNTSEKIQCVEVCFHCSWLPPWI